MQNLTIHALNERFAIPGHVTFRAGPGNLPLAEIATAQAVATVSVQVAQVIAYHPRGQAPVLWVSGQSIFALGKAIRGGIPICWPWFGPHPADPSLPAHGFARTSTWTVLETSLAAGDVALIRLAMVDVPATRAIWPHAFRLEAIITLGGVLQVELVVQNPGVAPFQYTGALHTYLHVQDITRIAIHGLDGSSYRERSVPGEVRTQQGPVTIGAETDRLYAETTAACVVEDPALDRRIHVEKSGSRSTVVWNPWVEKARDLVDFGDEEYRSMVCVEAANAGSDAIVVDPGGEHRLGTRIRVERKGATTS